VKLKLDENLPESLLATLAALRHSVDNVRSEGLSGQTDADVWKEAQKAERFFITQDLDFSDIRKFSPGTGSIKNNDSKLRTRLWQRQ
jgi:predicted nuclease of predicted toxin-antitoxin system